MDADGSVRRDFTHVSDIGAGLMSALYADKVGGEAINLGHSDPIEIRSVIQMLEQSLNKTAIIDQRPPRPEDLPTTFASLDKAKRLLNYQPKNIIKYYDIPFIPIELFRNHHISSNQNLHEAIFLSSGTTSNTNSQHYIYDLELYKKSVLASFSLFFGNPQDFIFLCLVPNYNTHINSSLSFMCMELIQKSNNEKSDFYINKYDDLKKVIIDCQKKNLKFILFGLSFEILHFAENYNIDLT